MQCFLHHYRAHHFVIALCFATLSGCSNNNGSNTAPPVTPLPPPVVSTTDPFTQFATTLIVTTSDVSLPIEIDTVALSQPENTEPSVVD
jgi:hypothetical protein